MLAPESLFSIQGWEGSDGIPGLARGKWQGRHGRALYVFGVFSGELVSWPPFLISGLLATGLELQGVIVRRKYLGRLILWEPICMRKPPFLVSDLLHLSLHTVPQTWLLELWKGLPFPYSASSVTFAVLGLLLVGLLLV